MLSLSIIIIKLLFPEQLFKNKIKKYHDPSSPKTPRTFQTIKMSSDNSNTNTGAANKGPSTAQSYIDSAIGTVQSAIGNITGSAGQEQAGETRKDGAQKEYDASHATLKGPGFTASSAGAVTRDDPNRSTGSWNQTLGSAKEAIGGLVGSEVSPTLL